MPAAFAAASGWRGCSITSFERHPDRIGEISRKHGDTLVGVLRKHYGASFAKGCAEDEKLKYVLYKLDERSLSKLVRDHEAGKLEKVCGEEDSSRYLQYQTMHAQDEADERV